MTENAEEEILKLPLQKIIHVLLPQSTDILWDSSQASPDARRAMPGICRLSAISLLHWHA